MPVGGQWSADATRRQPSRTWLRLGVGVTFLAGTLLIGVPPAIPAGEDTASATADARFQASPIQGYFVPRDAINLDDSEPVTVMVELIARSSQIFRRPA